MLIIRAAERKDRQAVIDMMKVFYDSPACMHIVPEENFINTLDEAVSGNPSVRVLVIEESNETNPELPANKIGFAHYTVSWSNEAGGKQIWFDELYLEESARGKGYGTEVFNRIEKDNPDVKRIRLEVTKENARAISLYERLGYGELPYYQMYKEFKA